MVSKLKLARAFLAKALEEFDSGSCLKAIYYSQKARSLMREFDRLLLKKHLNGCLDKLIRAGELETAKKEVLDLYKRS